ncbi:uncharacterized protein LOC143289746 [Babylonia areolata]|uniref:uncharacterized protein LOC143289746 n=1 Tax=Babylonia areolata TaxID=304850 RepID=UPI003FD60F8A
MALTVCVKGAVRLLYRLTVGLTVLLVRSGLLYLCCLLSLPASLLLVTTVTWKTYTANGHLGWTVWVGGLTACGCGGMMVGLYRLARHRLGLTSLSLGQFLCLLFLGRRPGRADGAARDNTTRDDTARVDTARDDSQGAARDDIARDDTARDDSQGAARDDIARDDTARDDSQGAARDDIARDDTARDDSQGAARSRASEDPAEKARRRGRNVGRVSAKISG